MLINLENLRRDNILPKIYNFLRKYNKELILLDQDAINVVCNKKLGFFPSYFISYGICDLNYLNMINKENLNNNRIKDLKEPYIFHFKIYTNHWYRIAKKRKFYFL